MKRFKVQKQFGENPRWVTMLCFDSLVEAVDNGKRRIKGFRVIKDRRVVYLQDIPCVSQTTEACGEGVDLT